MFGFHDAVAPKRGAMTSGPWLRRVGILSLLCAVVAFGVVGLVHEHADHEPVDEHRCASCHIQQTTVVPSRSDVLTSAEAPSGRAVVAETEPTQRLASRHAPPLRGPPSR